MTRFGRLRDGLMLVGIVMALLGGMALAVGAGLFVGGAKDARAQVTPGHVVFELCKLWETQGASGATQTFYFDVSDISQTTENIPITNVVEGSEARCIFLEAAPGPIVITEEFAGPQFFTPQWNSDSEQTRNTGSTASFFLTPSACLPFAAGLTLAELVAVVQSGPAVCTINFFNSDSEEPPPLASFQLCKDWDSNGVLNSGPRTFFFDVSDISQTRQISIPNVTEGGPPVCVTVEAPEGPVDVDEVEVAGFDTPEYWYNGSFQFASNGPFNFLLQDTFCALPIVTGTALLQEQNPFHSCIITVVNEDNDVATTTPTIVVCPRCNTVTATVPPPTSTPTPPPATATQPPPTATQVPPTATPTSITGGTGGLTDAQRTQTAVAAARTAAAQQTPLPPRTGLGADGGSGGGTGVNVALFAIGLVVLSGGLGLVAVRSRR